MRGISLEDITAATKIGKRLLRALEDEQFDLLPGGIFNKGYVRAYAKYVGIDEEQAVAEYLAAAGEPPSEVYLSSEQSLAARAEGFRDDDPEGRRERFPFIPILVVVVVLAGAAGGWQLYRQRMRDREQRTAKTSEVATSSVPAPAAPGPATPASGQRSPTMTPSAAPAKGGVSSAPGVVASTPTGESFEITVRPKDRAWVSIKSDGKILVKGIIQPPEVKTIRATSQIVFWTGNAGALEVSFNGVQVPLSSGVNDEQALVFNSHGLETRTAAQ